MQDREARRVDLVLRDGSVAVLDPDAVAEAVEQQRSQVGGGLDLQRLGIALVVRAADHDGIRLAFFDHFQKERPLLGHAVEVVGREQHDPSVGNRVDIGDAGLEQPGADLPGYLARDDGRTAAPDAVRLGRHAATVLVGAVQRLVHIGDRRVILAAGKVGGQRPGDRNLPLGSLGKRNADRVSDAVAEQCSDADGRLDATLAVVARLGNAQMQRIAHSLATHRGDQHPVSLHHHAHVARLD